MNNHRFSFPSNSFNARSQPAIQTEHPSVSEQRYRRLFETAEDGILILDARTLKIADANPFIARMLGHSRGSLIGKHLFDIGFKKSQPANQKFEQALHHHTSVRGEDLPIDPKNGGARHTEVVATRYKEGGQQVIQCNIRDVTERRKAQTTVEQLAAIVQTSPAAIIGENLKGEITSWNRGAERLFGYKAGEAIGRPNLIIIPPEQEQEETKILRRVGQGKSFTSLKTTHRRKDGTVVDVLLTLSPVKDATGKINGVSKIAQDLTQLTEAAETGLNEFAAKPVLNQVTDHAIFTLNTKGQVASWNTGAESLTGYKEKEIMGRHVSQFFTPEDIKAGKPERELRAATTTGQGEDDNWLVCKGGKRIWVTGSSSAIRNVAGKLTGFIKVTRNITGRKEKEEKVRTSELRYRRLFEAAHDGIVRLDPTTLIITDANPYFCEKTGRDRSEVIGRQFFELGLKRDEAASKAIYRSMRAKRCIRYDHLPLRTKAGRNWEVEVVANIYQEGDREVIQCNVRDFTERKLMEERHRQAAEMRSANLELKREIQMQRQLEREVMTVSDKEQRRIGQDLHDGLGAHLAGVGFLATSLHTRLKEINLPEITEAQRIVELVNQAVEQTRKLAWMLSPVSLERHGLMKALGKLAENIESIYTVSCRLICPRTVLFRDAFAGMNLFRIVQEAIHNAVTHGRAKNISFGLWEEDGAILVSVKSDGRPFPAVVPPSSGMGLKIMANRARALGATLNLTAGKNGGTIMTCTLPRLIQTKKKTKASTQTRSSHQPI